MQDALSRAAARPVSYRRFPDSLLTENRYLGRLAERVDDGRCAGSADIAALRREFGDLLTLDAWLAGPGKPLAARPTDTIDGSGATLIHSGSLRPPFNDLPHELQWTRDDIDIAFGHMPRLLWDRGVRAGRISMNRFVEITSTAPANGDGHPLFRREPRS